MADAPRETASLVRDPVSGQMFLQGREVFTPDLANVFGNGDFQPVCRAGDQRIVFEAEVRYGFSAQADDDRTDQAEVYSFRLWGWSVTPAGAQASLMFGDWEDFQGDDPPGAPYGWDALLYEAVHQLREARGAYRHHRIRPTRVVGRLGGL